MTAETVCRLFEKQSPTAVGTETVLGLLGACEALVYEAAGVLEEAEAEAENGLLKLPPGVLPIQVLQVLSGEKQCSFSPTGSGLLVGQSGRFRVFYRPSLPKLTPDTPLYCGEDRADLYLFYLMMKSALSAGDVAGYNNYARLFEEQLQKISRRRSGGRVPLRFHSYFGGEATQ